MAPAVAQAVGQVDHDLATGQLVGGHGRHGPGPHDCRGPVAELGWSTGAGGVDTPASTTTSCAPELDQPGGGHRRPDAGPLVEEDDTGAEHPHVLVGRLHELSPGAFRLPAR